MHASLSMIVIILFMTSQEEVSGRRRITDYEEAAHCHQRKCDGAHDLFNCHCDSTEWRKAKAKCIPMGLLCDGKQDCRNNADELDCKCLLNQFQCGSDRGGDVVDWRDQYNCISIALVGDGIRNCFNSKDEPTRWPEQPNLRCDGFIHYSDTEDEKNCDECPSWWNTNHCSCNKPGDFSCRGRGWTCYPDDWRCNGEIDCTDGSDEDGCKCRDDEFTCQCYKNQTKSCLSCKRGCFPMSKYNDGKEDCEDRSDERKHMRRTTFVVCVNITMRRLDNTKQHDDDKNCVMVPALNCTESTKCSKTVIICTSHCNISNSSQLCDTLFQCENGYMESAHNFCDGKVDCPDGSDQIRNQPGFKCSTSFGRCVLPQRNLHDDVAQCKNAEDLCSNQTCFECFDGKLTISNTQLCDGIIDCFNLSDECLCPIHFHKPVCRDMFALNDPSKHNCGKLNPQCHDIKEIQCNSHLTLNLSTNATGFLLLSSLICCQNKFNEITAVTCYNRHECKNFEDECSCGNPPSVCNNSCYVYYSLGDRYCDGKVDEAWKYMNDSSCPEGFDEAICLQLFACKAGNLLSIKLAQLCDGINDCDDGSGEESCMKDTIFSSKSEMIESIPLRCVFWIMAMFVVVGNCSVLFSTTRLLWKEKISSSQKVNHILILNLSSSDLLMGFYLFVVSVKSVEYSGYYGQVDYEWRTSLQCSIIGSLAIVSSQTSCFIITIVAAFRLYNICNPFTAHTVSTLKWKLGIIVAWSVSLLLALLPLFKATSNYFNNNIGISNHFTPIHEVWNKTDVITLACRLATLSNQSIEMNGDIWDCTVFFLSKYFRDCSPKGELGYYGETSVCMPRMYPNKGDQAWLYSLVIITFNFVSFLFVAISYAVVYLKTSGNPSENSIIDKENAKMQKRIARLVATDFACWIPICIMVFLKTGGVEIPNVVYFVTAGVLLPINSALNPLLYSSFPERLFKKTFFRKHQQVQQEFQIQTLN